MVSVLKRLGFDSVLDTDFTADLTIVEEGTELLMRLKKALVDKDPSVKLPMATSCSPGWIKYIEHMYPELLGILPQQIAAANVWGAGQNHSALAGQLIRRNCDGLDQPDAKKFESRLKCTQRLPGRRLVLTTRELAIMNKQAGIEYLKL